MVVNQSVYRPEWIYGLLNNTVILSHIAIYRKAMRHPAVKVGLPSPSPTMTVCYIKDMCSFSVGVQSRMSSIPQDPRQHPLFCRRPQPVAGSAQLGKTDKPDRKDRWDNNTPGPSRCRENPLPNLSPERSPPTLTGVLLGPTHAFKFRPPNSTSCPGRNPLQYSPTASLVVSDCNAYLSPSAAIPRFRSSFQGEKGAATCVDPVRMISQLGTDHGGCRAIGRVRLVGCWRVALCDRY